MTANAYEYAARQRKAVALADVMERAAITAEEASAYMTEDDWLRAAKAAGIKPPSDATKKMVVAELLIREGKRGGQ